MSEIGMTPTNTAATKAGDLLPCPFCGSKTLYVKHEPGTILHPAYYVHCDDCGAQSGAWERGEHIEEWNRRATPPAEPALASDAMVRHMVNRFLGWRLPKPWHPDNGISYTRPNYAHPPADHDWPIGTNLFDASQAEAMIRYMFEGAPLADNETTAILRWIMRRAESAKEPCGMDHESSSAIRNGVFAEISQAAAQALGITRGPSYEHDAEPASAAEGARLVAFAREVLGEFRLDTEGVQELGEKHGLLIPTKVDGPCRDEGCACAEVVDNDGWPVTCYRFAPILKGEPDRAQSADTPSEAVRFVETLSLFDPARMPERDAEDGDVSHPDLDLRCWYDGNPEDEAPIARDSFKALGFEIQRVDREDELGEVVEDGDDETCGGLYDKGGGFASWNPTIPDGDGWQLIAIYDSEDGPTSLFIRRIAPLESASRQQPARDCMDEAEGLSIEQDADVEVVAHLCGWDNRKYMTPPDYSIWCERMRKFVQLAKPALVADKQPARDEVSEAEVEAAADIILAKSGETRESVGEYSFSIIKDVQRKTLEAAARVRADHFVDANKKVGDTK